MNVIRSFLQRFSGFHFLHDDKNTVLTEIKILNAKKAVQDTDIPVKF